MWLRERGVWLWERQALQRRAGSEPSRHSGLGVRCVSRDCARESLETCLCASAVAVARAFLLSRAERLACGSTLYMHMLFMDMYCGVRLETLHMRHVG